MRLKRPRPASPDQVRITREGETAVIEYADPSVGVVNLQVGPSLAAMTDAQVLELFNNMLEAQAEIAAGVDPTLTEIPPGLLQIEYSERSDQWVPRGQCSAVPYRGRRGRTTHHPCRRRGAGPGGLRPDASDILRFRDAYRLRRRGGRERRTRDRGEGSGGRGGPMSGGAVVARYRAPLRSASGI